MPRRPKLQVEANREDLADNLSLNTSLFTAGDRVCVAVSGGADSTALLRALYARRKKLGIALSVLHVEHGLRGQAGLEDSAFVHALAAQLELHCQVVRVDTPKRMAEHKESMETAARALRYHVFREVLATGQADKVATAHTLDDQAETVLMKLLRGAWTEGLSGIHPILRMDNGLGEVSRSGKRKGAICVRPFLAVSRSQIETYLSAIKQPWRQDASNDSLEHTRNRIRHVLLPALREFNPRIDTTLAHMAENSRAEEQHWQAELDRVLPMLLLPGKPTRGGGRSVSTTQGAAELAIELARLRELDPGLRRRVVRAAAEHAGATLDFDATDRILLMIGPNPAGSTKGRRLELAGGLSVESSARELRFGRSRAHIASVLPSYELPVPGAVDAPAFRAKFTATLPQKVSQPVSPIEPAYAQVRAWQAGDKVELRHSRGPKKVKEILSRMRISAEDRANWPVVAWNGSIVWMRGVILANTEDPGRFAGSSAVTGGTAPIIAEIRD